MKWCSHHWVFIEQQNSWKWATSARVQRAGDRIDGTLAWESSHGGWWSLLFCLRCRGDLLTCVFRFWLAFRQQAKIFLITSRGVWLRVSCSVTVRVIGPGGDNCRVLLSEEPFLIRSRLSACCPPWSPGVSLVWGSLCHTFTPRCGCRLRQRLPLGFTVARGLDAVVSFLNLNPYYMRSALIYLHKYFLLR